MTLYKLLSAHNPYLLPHPATVSFRCILSHIHATCSPRRDLLVVHFVTRRRHRHLTSAPSSPLTLMSTPFSFFPFAFFFFLYGYGLFYFIFVITIVDLNIVVWLWYVNWLWDPSQPVALCWIMGWHCRDSSHF